MYTKIVGTGSYLPKKVLTNDDIAQLVDTNDEWIRERTGIQSRHIVEDETTVTMASMAAKDALENANYQKNSKKAGKRKEEKSPLLDCLRKEDVSARKEFTVHKRVCGNCADVCPNRANVLIEVPEMELLQIIHVDYMCNECGNCRSFCQYAGAPYKDKFTLFANEEDMKDSINNGFTVLDAKNKEIKIRIGEKEEVVRADQPSGILNKGLAQLICTVIDQYAYLLM